MRKGNWLRPRGHSNPIILDHTPEPHADDENQNGLDAHTPLPPVRCIRVCLCGFWEGRSLREHVITSSQEQQSGRAWSKEGHSSNFVLTTLCSVARSNLHSALFCGGKKKKKVKDSIEDSLSCCHHRLHPPNSLQSFQKGEGLYPKGHVKKGWGGWGGGSFMQESFFDFFFLDLVSL